MTIWLQFLLTSSVLRTLREIKEESKKDEPKKDEPKRDEKSAALDLRSGSRVDQVALTESRGIADLQIVNPCRKGAALSALLQPDFDAPVLGEAFVA